MHLCGISAKLKRMTIDERIERLEQLNREYAEIRRRDWEEDRQRFRELSSNIDAIWMRMERRDAEWDRRFHDENREWDRRFEAMRVEADARGKELDRRVGDLVTAIGELVRRLDKGNANGKT